MIHFLRYVLVGTTIFFSAELFASDYIGAFCPKEVKTYCGGRINESFMCLKKHLNELSPVCKSAYAAYTDEVLKYYGPCLKDPANTCKDLEPGTGLIARCLKRIAPNATKICADHIRKDYFKIFDDVGLDVVAICNDTIKKYCPHSKLGNFKIYNCLRDNRSNIKSDFCLHVTKTFK
jgi:hypothetical protein